MGSKWYVIENKGSSDELRHGPFKSQYEAEQWVAMTDWGDFVDLDYENSS